MVVFLMLYLAVGVVVTVYTANNLLVFHEDWELSWKTKTLTLINLVTELLEIVLIYPIIFIRDYSTKLYTEELDRYKKDIEFKEEE